MNQILILYSDDSDSHLALKKLKAYLREIHVKRENTKHHKKQTGDVRGASMGLARAVLNKDSESCMALKDKWSNKDNACKYGKEATRYFYGTWSKPLVLK